MKLLGTPLGIKPEDITRGESIIKWPMLPLLRQQPHTNKHLYRSNLFSNFFILQNLPCRGAQQSEGTNMSGLVVPFAITHHGSV